MGSPAPDTILTPIRNPNPTESQVIKAMSAFGGGFVAALSTAWHIADADNRLRLRTAFPEIWDRYTQAASQVAPDATVLDNVS